MPEKERPFTEAEITAKLVRLPGWSYQDGAIRRSYQTDGFTLTCAGGIHRRTGARSHNDPGGARRFPNGRERGTATFLARGNAELSANHCC